MTEKIEVRVFKCNSCDGEPEFDGAKEIIEHLKEVHKLEAKGTRQMQMHMRGSGFHRYIWEWEIGEVKLTEFVYRGVKAHAPK
ncbi:MAG: hypothetical protein GTO24_21305 [candidate division Zixibacteria bacterium]|nr:hypothetical protein [candidate division Zixibacteria bacterium]